MSFYLVSVVLDRKTGKVKEEKIIRELPDIDADEFYKPLGEIFYKAFMRSLQSQEGSSQ